MFRTSPQSVVGKFFCGTALAPSFKSIIKWCYCALLSIWHQAYFLGFLLRGNALFQPFDVGVREEGTHLDDGDFVQLEEAV